MGRAIVFTVLIVVLALVAVFHALNSYIYEEKQATAADDYRDAEYIINGERVLLVDGVSIVEAAPGSSSQIVTRYFGNEVVADLDGDGREDVAFILTQDTGGSGTFYYIVAALNTDRGFVGSEAVLLGDRIAPQTTELSRNPNHTGVIVVNYADRAPGEPMTAQPSVGKSLYLKLDAQSMQFGIVDNAFEGEADPSRMSLGMKEWVWVSALYNDGKEVEPKDEDAFTITFAGDGSFSATTDCNRMFGSYIAENGTITFSGIGMTKMYCNGSQEMDFLALLENSSGYHFTSRGQLILDLKFDSGSVTFR